MAKDWDYARLSQEAKAGGGPYKGAADMKNQLVIPLLLTGVTLGSLATIGYQKNTKWISSKMQDKIITEQEAEKVEEYLKKELDYTIENITWQNIEK